MSIYQTYTLSQLVNIVYAPEEADEFMSNSHKGAFAKAVCGDAEEFIRPETLSGEQLEKARNYFIQICQKLQPALA